MLHYVILTLGLVHGEEQNKIHEILRVFDLYVLEIYFWKLYLSNLRSYEYGPCIGITRLERWDRADALGLKPLHEVRCYTPFVQLHIDIIVCEPLDS